MKMREITFEELDKVERLNYRFFLEKLIEGKKENIEKKIGYKLPSADSTLSNTEFIEQFPDLPFWFMATQFLFCKKHRAPSLVISFFHILRCPFCRELFLRVIRLKRWET